MADGDLTDATHGNLSRPLAGDRDGWRTYWTAQGQPWRTEPEIDAERQSYLASLRTAAIPGAPPPFRGVRLDRADVEWMLATHEDAGMVGPVDREDETQRKLDRMGLKLHGADLRGADLSGLPLDRLTAGAVVTSGSFTSDPVPLPYRRITGDPLDDGAPLLLDGANLSHARLQGAFLRGAHLHGANLSGAFLHAYLDEADLTDANLTGADLAYAKLEKANLTGATLTRATMSHASLPEARLARACLDSVDLRQAWCWKAHFEDADLRGAHLEGADLSNTFLERADLRGASLHQVISPLRRGDLMGTILNGAHLDGALLAGAYVEGVECGYVVTGDFPWQAFAETLSTSEEVQAARRTPALDPAERDRWRAHWDAQGQPWRTQPEISAERQASLAERRAVPSDFLAARYPFIALDPPLTRADVEWLLATHDDGRGHVGPVDWTDEAQRERIGLDLRGADLRYLDLSGLPLARMVAGLTMDEASDLIKTPGSQSTFPLDVWRVHLEGANLRGAQLQGALLRQGCLERADLAGADLSKANIQKANLRWATLEGACLDDTAFDSAQCIMVKGDRATFRQADCSSTKFFLASLVGAQFLGARESSADFTGAHLDGAAFTNARLWGTIFDQATAREARFDHLSMVADKCTFKRTDLSRAQFMGSDLSAADFTDACLDGADLSGVTLEDSNFTGARLCHARLDGAVFRHNSSSVQHASLLIGADLEGASLTRAKIEHADLTRARLVASTLEGVSLVGSNLTDVDASGADLRGAVLDATTTADGLRLGDAAHGTAMLCAVRWGGVDVSAVQWATLPRLGDERLLDHRSAADGARKDRVARRKALDDVFRAYHAVSVTLNNQGLNEQAEVYAYRMRVLQRRLAFQSHRFGRWLFALLLGVLTGYGYRLRRIFVAYLGIVLACAAAYVALGHLPGAVASAHLSFPSAVLVSITAFHGRVFSEPFAAGSIQLWVTAIEAVFGLVIEGVFVAMLTKKFFGQ